MAADDFQDLRPRDDGRGRPASGAADVHVFDETDLGADGPAELEQIDELLVIDAADHDGVDLERAEGRPRRRGCRR